MTRTPNDTKGIARDKVRVALRKSRATAVTELCMNSIVKVPAEYYITWLVLDRLTVYKNYCPKKCV